MEFDADTNINITKDFEHNRGRICKSIVVCSHTAKKISVTTLTQFQALNSFSERRHEKRLSLTNFLMAGSFNTAALIFSENN